VWVSHHFTKLDLISEKKIILFICDKNQTQTHSGLWKQWG